MEAAKETFNDGKLWTKKEDEFLKRNYKEMGVAELSKSLGRSYSATRERIAATILPPRSRETLMSLPTLATKQISVSVWRKRKEDFITIFENGYTIDEYATASGITPPTLRKWLRHLQLNPAELRRLYKGD